MYRVVAENICDTLHLKMSQPKKCNTSNNNHRVVAENICDTLHLKMSQPKKCNTSNNNQQLDKQNNSKHQGVIFCGP